MPGFVHLHVHSSYSLLEGALSIARLCELAKADRQPALALTDTDNMFGALEFSEKLAGYGIQPIVGCALRDVSAITFFDGLRVASGSGFASKASITSFGGNRYVDVARTSERISMRQIVYSVSSRA